MPPIRHLQGEATCGYLGLKMLHPSMKLTNKSSIKAPMDNYLFESKSKSDSDKEILNHMEKKSHVEAAAVLLGYLAWTRRESLYSQLLASVE